MYYNYEHAKLKPGLVALYNIQPAKRTGAFLRHWGMTNQYSDRQEETKTVTSSTYATTHNYYGSHYTGQPVLANTPS